MEKNQRAPPHVNVDRISSLPEPILHHILSFLKLEHVAQTCVLSKTWKRVWHSYPAICFDRYFSSMSTQKRVLKGLERTLLNRHRDAINLEKIELSLYLPTDPKSASDINRCLSCAIASNVKDFRLCFGEQYCEMKYRLPPVVYYAKSIVMMELVNCKLDSPANNVTLSALKELCLFHCTVNGDTVRDIIAGCPSIECLKIVDCEGFRTLEFLNLSTLKNFVVHNVHGLERMYIGGACVRSVYIRSLHMQSDINVALCKNLTELKLGHLSITDEWFCNQIPELPFLECLEIFGCMGFRIIKISSHHLKKLFVRNCNKLDEIKLDTPNLSVFEYEGHMVSLYSNALSLTETRLSFDSANIDNQWYVKLIELLAKLNRCSNVLNLDCYKSVFFSMNFEFNTFSLAKLGMDFSGFHLMLSPYQ